MRSENRRWTARKSLVISALLLTSALTAAGQPSPGASPEAWIHSPYRNFGPAQTVLPGRAILFDEADDPALPGLLAVEMRRLFDDLYTRQGWRNPFSESQPLRIFVARKEAEGVRRLAARSMADGLLVAPAVLLDGSGWTAERIVREVSLQVALATLKGYGVADGTFLTEATASLLSSIDASDDVEATLVAAAAPELSVDRNPSTLGRLFVEELSRAGGPGFLVRAWERAAESDERILPVLLESYGERTGETAELPLARFAARLYSTLEPEAAPSRVGLLDLQAGALDAAAPAGFTLRHRTYLPGGDGASALRVSWPEDASAGAVVVRYRDSALPPDVLLLSAGDVRTVPLGGVARLDWIVAGGFPGGTLSAPAGFETAAAFPYGGLSAHATGGPDGPRITWNTASHEGLAGWAIFREEVQHDGRIARTGPEIIPSSNRAPESFAYAYLDPAAHPATFYRYTVWAVTEDGLLSRAFSVTLRSSE